MIGGEFILLIFLMMLNLLLIIKRVPLIGVPVGIFTFYMCVAYFINESVASIPANPYTTALLSIFAGAEIVAQSIELGGKKKR